MQASTLQIFHLPMAQLENGQLRSFTLDHYFFFKPVFLQAAFWEIINLTGWTSWSRQLLTGSKQHNNTETGNMQLAVTALKNIKLEWQLQFQASLGRKLKRTLLLQRKELLKKKKTTLGKYLEKQGAQIRLVFFYVYFIVLMIKFISSVPMI